VLKQTLLEKKISGGESVLGCVTF